MNNLHFVCEKVTDASPSFGTFLFNQKQHLFLQSKSGWWCYKIKKNLLQTGFIYLNINGKKACSPVKAPFGSFDISKDVAGNEFEKWIDFILQDLTEKGVREIAIKHYPSIYQKTQTAQIKKLLAKKEFKRSKEIASVIAVDRSTFESKIVVAKKQKLRKCLERFTFYHNHVSQLKKNYTFIFNTRKEKGFKLSMTYSDLQKTVKQFPGDFLLFAVSDAETVIAASICIKVNQEVLYTFYYAHDSAYNKISPIVMLLNGIYAYAQENKFKKLDLGTSQLGDKINIPLLHFKESVGGKPSAKYTFTKSW